MKLYGSYTSPFVRHCRIVLLETAQECEFIETDAAASATQSPTKRVPFLQDGEQFFSDSSAIVKHLRSKAGQVFFASDREFDEFCLVNTTLDATLNLFFIERDSVNIKEVPYLQRQAARIASCLAELDSLPLPEHPPYNDTQLRLACYIGWALFRKRIDFSPYPNLLAFYAGINLYPHFLNTAPEQ